MTTDNRDALMRALVQRAVHFVPRLHDDWHKDAAAALAQSQPATDGVREALSPFAKAADALSDNAPDETALGLLIDGLYFGPGMPCIGDLRRARAALSPQPVATPVEWASFQARVKPWMLACFGEEISRDGMERNHRFLEEALELVQSTGCTRSEAHQLVDYVFDRPVGEPVQEVGGVMVTLAALCLAFDMDMHAAGETELARIWTKVEAIRAKQAAKPKHSPLPQHVATPVSDTDEIVRAREAWAAHAASEDFHGGSRELFEAGYITALRSKAPQAGVEEGLREALGRCRELFAEIRGDYTDPRHECREGMAIIDEALRSTALPDTDMREALKPFARAASAFADPDHRDGDDELRVMLTLPDGQERHSVVIGDFRRARRALNGGEG